MTDNNTSDSSGHVTEGSSSLAVETGEGDELRASNSCSSSSSSGDPVRSLDDEVRAIQLAAKRAAHTAHVLHTWQKLTATLDPILPQLLASLDPHAADSGAGNTLLHLLARRFGLVPWMQQLCARLVERGLDPNAFNDDGRTPILVAAWWGHASNILLFRSLGADDGAQDRQQGNTVLHLLALHSYFDAMQELFAEGWTGLGLLVRNHKGQTPAEVAAERLTTELFEKDRKQSWAVAQLLAQQTELFRINGLPLLRRMLSAHLLPDLASIVVGYIDGSGPAHPSAAAAAAAAAESKENDGE